MGKTIEGVGRTVDDAVQNALADLNVPVEAVSIEVLDEGEKGGLLGMGRRDARVRVSLKEEPAVEAETATVAEGDGADQAAAAPAAAEPVSYVLPQSSLDPADDEEEDAPEAPPAYYGDSEDTDSSRPLRPAGETAVEYVKKALSFFDLNETVEATEEDGRLYVDIDTDAAGVVIGRRGETLDALQYLTSIAVNRFSDEHVRVTVDVSGYRRRRRKRLEQNALRMAEEVKLRQAEYVMEPMGAADRRIVHYALQGVPGVRTESEGVEPNRAVVIIPTDED